LEIKKIGVVGCGIMGRGIVEITALAGYPVKVSEINQELLDKGLKAINLSLTIASRRGRITEEIKNNAVSSITGVSTLEELKDCDLVIEAATENIELKKKIFADLDTITPPHAMLATNTSCLSIIDIASATKRPEKVLGMHYFNPVPVMKLLELVRSILTDNETAATARMVGERQGKTVVMAPDMPGFIVNRLLTPYLIDAVRLLESGFATREDIDTSMVLGTNIPMGPFALADLIGLDTAMFICESIYREIHKPYLAPPLLLRKMVTAGILGKKTGRGFYNYTPR
jgi:3-hydroxybutyryl-CoA dehydrogenase